MHWILKASCRKKVILSRITGMSETDIMAPSEAISLKWTQFPSEKRWKLKNFKEKYVQKSVKSCNYPELSVQLSGVFI